MKITDVCYRVSIKSYMNTIPGRFNGTKNFDVISAIKMWRDLNFVAQIVYEWTEKIDLWTDRCGTSGSTLKGDEE